MIDHRGARIVDVTPETGYDDVYRALYDEAEGWGMITLRLSDDILSFGISLQALVAASRVWESRGRKIFVHPGYGKFGMGHSPDHISFLVCSWAPKYEGEGPIQFDNVVLYDTVSERSCDFEWEE